MELQKRKIGGAKTSRSETVTVRLEPKLRYFAELAARRQRRTLSSFIEWTIQKELEKFYLEEPSEHSKGVTMVDSMHKLWDVDEEVRFIKLGLYFPDLMTHEEQIVWKLIRENGALWYGAYTGLNKEWIWRIEEKSLDYDLLRDHWPIFFSVARGERDRSVLPEWERFNPNPNSNPCVVDDIGFFGPEDDVPF
ncbi:Uncharacterized protein MCB1EB_1798 [Mycoavidus cysteinexigens]|uniref:Uncharacterized protein n=1 Tax=Mycoavidus cysteinexigens TaxID=1553431 RepID=A0A2Z6EWY4_9BURK|nr:hypothetical protein [Mycoavidus cysteinexigens]BBE09959.1 Uncharacterized protein MCB1EB_1798 [Mycoavidus cysteinexigens]GAM53695.1 hypothetical protein EBME_2158 [bacterium endosymbiont of Mortierella elongata FMR23-6]GLR00399.1 hypothetical protein GCM10007934_02100 [Mycoavidus cysteinexigens]